MRKKRGHIIDDIHLTPDASYIQNPDVSHETSDVNVRSIIVFAGGLLVFGIIVHILMWLMFQYMEDRARKSDPPPRPMAMSEQERLQQMPGPRLQGAPGFSIELDDGQKISLERREPQAEYRELKKIWEDVLAGKPDRRDHKVSMPIDEAMRQVIANGELKPRAAAPGQQPLDIHGGMDIPSFYSSGRKMEKRDQ